MEVGQMQRRFVEFTKSLFMELRGRMTPDFVVEVVSLFFQDSKKLLNDLTSALEQRDVDFKKVDAHVHQLKGSSSNIGAQRVKNACFVLCNFCEDQNLGGCMRCLQQVKQEFYLAKNKFETLFTMERQIVAASDSIPAMEITSF
ncbi:hypothetical protein BT93_L3760 [Corymbia citriodora subsp. variegata]|uniref:Histidine-containing phosphotransfer protein n=1 Tax=Corymbia citriodora subsp. variegata TaxID=360336 RepID=A0A8T0CGQ7_CORYI|nr:hypothetical protein BT93_L3760 [Corymbia citriodora subsp. variegata]